MTPSTRLFGLLMNDPRDEGHVTRLYNYLFGFNGLDAAYLSFVLKPEHVVAALDGFVKTRKAELLHVAPVHQQAVERWLKHADVGALRIESVSLDPEAVLEQAVRELDACFGITTDVPSDWRDVLDEKTFRPCKLTHDDFKELHAARRTA
jgi:hypothetical protein